MCDRPAYKWISLRNLSRTALTHTPFCYCILEQKRRRQRVRERGDDHEFSMTQELQDLFSDCTYLFRFFGEHYLDGERSERAGGGSRKNGGGRQRRRKRLGDDDRRRRPLPPAVAAPPVTGSLSPRRVRSLSPRRRPTTSTAVSAEWA